MIHRYDRQGMHILSQFNVCLCPNEIGEDLPDIYMIHCHDQGKRGVKLNHLSVDSIPSDFSLTLNCLTAVCGSLPLDRVGATIDGDRSGHVYLFVIYRSLGSRSEAFRSHHFRLTAAGL